MCADVADLDMLAVEREMTVLAGHLAAGTCRFLELLAVFDTGGGWHGTGIRTCTQWLSWRCGLSPSAAGEQLRVAHALEDLPVVRRAFAAGRISFSKARALTRVAAPENEAALVDTAIACTASQLDRLCAGIGRARSNEEVVEQAARASFSSRWEPDGSLRFSGQLSAEDGATLLAALAAVRPDPIDPADPAVTSGPGTADPGEAAPGRDGGSTPQTVHRPDAAAAVAHSDAAALVLLAEHALSDPPAAVGASPVRLVIHATADAFSDDAASAIVPATVTNPMPGADRPSAEGSDTAPPTSAEGPNSAAHPSAEESSAPTPSAEGPTVAVLDAGPGIPLIPLGPDTLRRLACEALVEPASHPDTEPTTAVQHRFASARQRRALLARDEGCAFVGCRRRRGLHAHHLQPWSEGGPTTLQNLVLICAHHHRLIHEGGWQLRPRPDQRFDAVGPDGHVLRPAPNIHGTAGQLPTAHDADIRPATVTGTWTGEPLDLGYAVSVYAQRSA